MIVAQTRLKKIPDKCNKCRFCINDGIVRKASKESNWCATSYIQKRCSFNGALVPYVYNKAKRNWEYLKCKSCPLKDIDD